MAYYPYAPSYADVMWLVSPDTNTIARFNGATTDANWCGVITETAGLDSPDVRESAEELVEADGGAHGNFWFGRRPIILSGVSYGHTTVAQRNAKYDRINRASLAMRGDAELHIQPQDGGPELMTWVRRQEKIKWDGGWNKTFQIPLVSQYARIFSAALHLQSVGTPTFSMVIENQGSYPSQPALVITGPLGGSTPTSQSGVNNTTDGKKLQFIDGAFINSGQTVTVDTVNHTATASAVSRNGTRTNGSAVITGLGYTVDLAVGMSVTGANIPAGTVIQSIDSATQITLTQPAGAAGVTSLTFSGDWTANINFLQTTWPTVVTGNNTLALFGPSTSAVTQLQAQWRDTWV